MKAIQNVIMFVPTMISYLVGGRMFHERDYEGAINKFEKCLNHPGFQNEILFSFYGQALCAVGRMDEGHNYLIKACEAYELGGWTFEREFDFKLAKNTLDALKYVSELLNIENSKEFLTKNIQLKRVNQIV